MTILLVTNPASGSFDADTIARVEHALADIDDVASFSASSADAFVAELRSASSGCDVVAVAGGDGSLSVAVNALGDRLDRTRFGIIPMGTGNDLAETLKLERDPVAAAEGLRHARTLELDLGAVANGSGRRLFVNACVGGFSVDVDEALEEETKRKLGRFAFWVGGLRAATDIDRYTVRVDGREIADAVVVGIGNGRTVGGGLELWPDAAPDDGELDVCVISAPHLADGVRAAVKVKRGTHEADDGVTTSRGRRVRIEAEPPMAMNVDGEVLGLHTPLTFEIAGKLRLLVPPA